MWKGKEKVDRSKRAVLYSGAGASYSSGIIPESADIVPSGPSQHVYRYCVRATNRQSGSSAPLAPGATDRGGLSRYGW